jgi:hypothetical protein
MPDSPIITGLMFFFSVTTLVVIAYPVVKLLPSWLERSVYRKVAFNRDAIEALDIAAARCTDPDQRSRLVAQARYHRAALANLAPNDPALAPKAAERVEIAA